MTTNLAERILLLYTLPSKYYQFVLVYDLSSKSQKYYKIVVSVNCLVCIAKDICKSTCVWHVTNEKVPLLGYTQPGTSMCTKYLLGYCSFVRIVVRFQNFSFKISNKIVKVIAFFLHFFVFLFCFFFRRTANQWVPITRARMATPSGRQSIQ